MNPPPQVPPLINSRPTITYELTRGDLFWNLLTILVRNRVARMAVALCMVVNVFITVRGEFGKHPLTFFVAEVIICFVMFLGLLCVVIAIVAFALAFLSRQRGVIGQHVIEITEEGLRERTEFNDSLHKWTS